MLKLGLHVSISGSIDRAVDRAVEKGCNTFQIFTRNPRGWRSRDLTREEVEAFIEKVEKFKIEPVFGHMPYLPNLASPKDETYRRSVESLITELRRCVELKIPYLVTHLGSHLGAGMEIGFERIIKAVNRGLSEVEGNVMLLLENTAGTKNSMGGSFEDIRYIIERVDYPERVGVCFDTCHGFAAGYDLRTMESVESTIKMLDEVIGFEKLKLVHLNDSKGGLNSRIDRHEHIGMGMIGEEGFRNILKSRLGQLPLILETPIDKRRSDVENLQKVRELAGETEP
ncbi:MAG: putative endonuclease IV [Candidatus Bathyarchaeota archaeon B26-1]|nr:MAG: putative endonuclease IV [Candidatus Bathyarchaeota archaeon B26-1]